MITADLLATVQAIATKLDEKYSDLNLSEREMVLAKALKLSEEVWELQQITLSKYFKRREWEFDQWELEDELADVILTTLILWDSLDIDMNKALKKKLEKIHARGGL